MKFTSNIEPLTLLDKGGNAVHFKPGELTEGWIKHNFKPTGNPFRKTKTWAGKDKGGNPVEFSLPWQGWLFYWSAAVLVLAAGSFAILANVSQPHPAEKAIADFVQTKDGVWTDMKFKSKNIEQVGVYLGRDSVEAIRLEMLEKEGWPFIDSWIEAQDKLIAELPDGSIKAIANIERIKAEMYKRKMDSFNDRLDSVLLDKVSCTYEIVNPLAGNARQIVTDTFLVTTDYLKVISNE